MPNLIAQTESAWASSIVHPGNAGLQRLALRGHLARPLTCGPLRLPRTPASAARRVCDTAPCCRRPHRVEARELTGMCWSLVEAQHRISTSSSLIPSTSRRCLKSKFKPPSRRSRRWQSDCTTCCRRRFDTAHHTLQAHASEEGVFLCRRATPHGGGRNGHLPIAVLRSVTGDGPDAARSAACAFSAAAARPSKPSRARRAMPTGP